MGQLSQLVISALDPNAKVTLPSVAGSAEQPENGMCNICFLYVQYCSRFMVAVVTCAIFHSYLYSTRTISVIYTYKTSRKKIGNPDVHRVKNAMPCYDVRYLRILCAAVKTRNTFTAGQIKDLSYLMS